MKRLLYKALDNAEAIKEYIPKRKQCLAYAKCIGAYYTLTYKNQTVCAIKGTLEQYYEYLSGNNKAVYPEFDDKVHSVEIAYPVGKSFRISDHKYQNNEMIEEDGIPFVVSKSTPEDSLELPSGAYKLVETNELGPALVPFTMHTDSYLDIRESNTNKLIYDDLKIFMKSKNLYEKEHVRHKKGALLYGPPGNGKTREIEKILENAEDFIGIFIPSKFSNLSDLDNFREALNGKNVVFVIEELTERLSGRHSIEQLLSFLDGEMSWNNAYVIATTNHPEEIPANIIDRPGRFELVIEFGNPTKSERMKYLLARDYTPDEATIVADLTEGLSLDYLVQVVTQSRVLGISIKDYIKTSKTKRDKIAKSFKPSMGIGNKDNED